MKSGLYKNNQGIAHLGLLIILGVVVLVIGFAAYRVYSSQKGDNSASNSQQKTVRPQGISSKEDLSQAVDSINENTAKTDTKKEEKQLKELAN